MHLSCCVATSAYGYDGLGFVSRCFRVEATDPACVLYRLGSDATNKQFPCVKFQRMRGFPPLRYSNRRVARRNLRCPRIQLHLMQGKGDFLASASGGYNGSWAFLHQVLPDATQTLYPLLKSHLMRRAADVSGINL